MANYRTVFIEADGYPTKSELECSATTNGDIYLAIEDSGVVTSICLDISTAIKFSKTLRTEINKAKEVIDG